MINFKVALRTLSLTMLAVVAMGFGKERSAFAQQLGPFAFQASTNYLWIYQANGHLFNTNQRMAAGTVPSVSMFGATVVVGFQGANGHFWIDEWNGITNTATDSGGTMKSGTSPSITHLSNGALAFGFQGINGHLWIGLNGPTSGKDTGALMAIVSNPSVAGLLNGNLAIAFRGWNTHLWVSLTGPSGGHDTGGVIADGTSPSIAGLGNSTVAFAFQGSDGYLWFGEGNGFGLTHNFGYRMVAGTSPSVAVDVTFDAWVTFFNASVDGVSVFDIGGSGAFGTANFQPFPSPSLTVSFTNPQVAFKGGNGDLWTFYFPNSYVDEGIQMN
jgi:hypothetical protein